MRPFSVFAVKVTTIIQFPLVLTTFLFCHLLGLGSPNGYSHSYSDSVYAAVQGQSSSGGSETQNFCYNESNQLIWAGNSGTQPSSGNCGSAQLANSLGNNSYSSRFAYTHLGQLWQGPLNGTGASLQYLYCDSTHPHQLSGIYPQGTTCASLSGTNYASKYDAWGNVTSRTSNAITATLSYNPLDQFIQWSAGASNQEQYSYNATGDRVLRRSTSISGTSMTVYAFGLEEHVKALLQRARQVIGRANLDHATLGAAKGSDGTWLASINQRVAKDGVTDLKDTVALQLKDMVEGKGAKYVGPTELAPSGTELSALRHAEDYLVDAGPDSGGLDGIGTETRLICDACKERILSMYPNLEQDLRTEH